MNYDETKREQTHYKQIIKDSFSQVIGTNSRVCKNLFLEAALNEMSMRMKLLDLSKEEPGTIKLDNKTTYVILKGKVEIKK